MPNFFKKLTGALQIPEEDELFEEKSDESVEEEASLSEETQEPIMEEEEEGAEQDEFGEGQDESDEEQGENAIAPQEEGEAGMEEVSPQEEPQGDMDEGEKPFTIAQFARAKTEKKAGARRFSTLHVKEEAKDEGELASGMPEGQLAIDVYETDSEIVLKSTIAGVKPEDLDIGIEENTVNIRGSRHQEDKVKGGNYFYQECYWGTFSRSVILPVEVDSEKVEASLKDGILTIRLPKILREKEKKIKVLTD